jgi:hypothetical protein
MGTGKEVYATLKIASSTLCAKDIASILGLIPSELFKKGEMYGKRSPRLMKESICFFESKTSRHEPIEEHIAELLKLLVDKIEQIEYLSKYCDITLFGFYSTDSGQGGICLSHELICQLALLRIDLIFDLHLSETDDH